MNCDKLCNPCVNAKWLTLPVCQGEYTLNIGTIEADTEYNVYIKNLDSGIVRTYEVESDSNGELILDLWACVPFINRVALFKLWVQNGNEVAELTIEDASVPCLNITFEAVYDNEGFPFCPTEQTITL